MGWPYEFTGLTTEQKHLRREALNRYAAIAHFSAFAPAAVFLLVRLARYALRFRPGFAADGHGEYQEVPRSPVVKARRLGVPGGLGARWRMLCWWMADDVYFAGAHWGRRDDWIFGLSWAAWLLALCVVGTGTDYFHLTKRFGTIAVSQFPIHYLMSLKIINPIAWAFGTSHESVNRYHRVLGRIIQGLLVLHAVFYNFYFLFAGIWLKRFFAPIVFCGVVALLALDALYTTTITRIRDFSYRAFFITHLVVALLVPVLIFFHAPSVRFYIVEAFAVFIVDLAGRKATTVTATATLETIPGTTLVKVSAAVPTNKAASFRARPGSHIYLSLPPASRTAAIPASKSAVFDFLYNPFTVVSADDVNGSISFVARTRGGPMTNVLSQFASEHPPSSESRTVSLAIEGPYGTMGKSFHSLLAFGAGRILLIAGGVGATFAVPIYHAILHENPSSKVRLVWAIRSAGDATWAVSGGDADGKSLLDDENVQIFLTDDMGVVDQAEDTPDNAIQMSTLQRDRRRERYTADHNRRRPNIEKIVDEVFRQGREETVAVIVCGPVEMAREVRLRVRPWVMSGRNVWLHDESFGW